jgi:hypothetical protein
MWQQTRQLLALHAMACRLLRLSLCGHKGKNLHRRLLLG